MFGLKLFSRKKQVEEAPLEANRRVFLHCTELGWQGLVVDTGGAEREDRLGAVLPVAVGKGGGNLEEAFRLAGEHFSSREAKGVDEVLVLTDDPDVHYSDMLAEVFSAASPATLRELGSHQLGTNRVTFGQAVLVAKGETAERRTIAWGDSKRAGTLLTRLTHVVPKVSRMVPVADLLARRIVARGQGPGAVLYLGGYSSHLMIVNPAHGAVLSRVLPVGSMTLIQKAAEQSGAAVEEVARNLRTSDYVSGIRLGDEFGDRAALTQSQIERILGEDLQGLLRTILASIEFFDLQRSSGAPERIELFGAFDDVRGLDELLINNLPVAVERSAVSLLDVFRTVPPLESLNLLEHIGNDFRIGSISYGFKERLVPVTRASQEAQPSRADQQATHSQRRTRQQQARPTARAAARGRSGASSGAGLLSGLLASLRNVGAQKEVVETEDESVKKDRQWVAFFGLFAVIVLYLGYQNFYEAQTADESRVSAANEALTVNQRTRDALGRIELQRTADETGADKVLWTEKFLALAKNMDEGMWLTDLFLANEQHSGGQGGSSVNKKLVMEGAVLPSTDGHIQHIATYIKKMEDDKSFMSDFREINGITFSGAHIETGDNDPIIRFGLEAWYDEARHILTRPVAAVGAGNASLGNTVSAAEQHNREAEAALNGKLK